MSGSFVSLDDLDRMQPAPQGAAPASSPGFVPLDALGQPTEESSMPAVAGNALLRGLTGLLGLPGTLSDFSHRLVRGGMEAAGLIPENVPPAPEFFGVKAGESPVSAEKIQEKLREGGVLDRPGTEPQTPAQRYVAAGVEGAAGAPFGPAAVVTGVLGGLGGEAAADAAGQTEWGKGPTAQAAARVIGSVAGGVGGGAALNAGAKAVNAARGVGDATTAAFDRAGVTPRMVADVTGSPTAARAQQAVSGMPGGTGQVSRAAQRTEREYAAAVDRAASMLGSSPTPQMAGEALQNGTRAWIRDWRQQSDAAWNNFWGALRPNINSRLTATRTLLAGNATDLRREAPELAQLLEGNQMQAIREAVTGTTPLSGKALRQFRTRIGEMLDNATLAGGEDEAALRRLYGALTTDLESLAAANGRPAVEAFREASRITREGHELLDSTGKHILGSPKAPKAPEEAYRWTVGQANLGDTRLASARRVAGDAAVDDAAGVVLRGGAEPANNAGGSAVASGPRLNTTLNRMSPEGRAELFRNAQQQVDDLGVVAGRMTDTARLANNSQTAGTSAYQNLLRDMVLFGGGGAGLFGTPGAAAGAVPLLTPLAANLVARAVTSPSVARFTAAPGLLNLTAGQRARLGLLSGAEQAGLLPNGQAGP